jgi:uncharacterized protein (DUF302 family)
MQPPADNGVVTIPSNHSVDDTVSRVQELLRDKGIALFALVDHSGEAAKVGMPMRPTKLLIFGSPRAGTPVMIASPRAAIDLPLKLLVWEDAGGKVGISYNAVEYLRDRHQIPAEMVANIGAAAVLAAKAAE